MKEDSYNKIIHTIVTYTKDYPQTLIRGNLMFIANYEERFSTNLFFEIVKSAIKPVVLTLIEYS